MLIQPLDTDQKQVTFHAAGISKMPDLQFTAGDTIIGEVGFKLIGKNNTAIDDSNRLFTSAANALAAVPYDPDALLVQSYQNRWMSDGTFTLTFGADTTTALDFDESAAAVDVAFDLLASVTAAGGATVTGDLDAGWTITFDANGARGAITGAVTGMPGGTTVKVDVLQEGDAGKPEIVRVRLFPWHNFAARSGVKVSFNTTITEDSSDAIGVYDAIFSGLSVTLSAEPQGLDWETVLLAAGVQGTASVPGRKISTGSHNFDVIGDGVFFRLYGANIDKSGLIYGATKQRVPELQWSGSRSVGAGGAINPLFFIGTEPPA
ncbi:MAG TPA: hypothetical protein VFV83_08765 [Chthoniobacteraceae bacterium]|nr:hypothetical protein [Chthoniobacteraceae bacterium]